LPRSVFLTGTTGFVGTALAARLVEAGDHVRGLVRATSSRATVERLRGLGVQLVQGDVAPPTGPAYAHDDEGVFTRAMDGVDLVVHAAAVIGYRRRLAGAMWSTNVLGTRRVVRAALAAGCGRFVHVSSIAAVGAAREPRPLDERSPFDAADTKHAAEREVALGVGHGLPATTVNPGAIYGASWAVSNSSRVVEGVARRPPPFVPPGGINVVTLGTVVQGILAAAERGRVGRRVILGCENLTLAQLVERIARAAGKQASPRELPAPLVRAGRVLGDLVEPLVPDSVWYAPHMASVAGRWMWYDTRRMERELRVSPGDVDACLAETVAQLRRDGRL